MFCAIDWDNVPNIPDERREGMEDRSVERAYYDAIIVQQQARQMIEFNEIENKGIVDL